MYGPRPVVDPRRAVPGGLFLADTSALARIIDPAVARELDRLGRLGLLATCVTVDLEVLYSARSPDEYAAISHRRTTAFTDLPLRSVIGTRAKAVQAAWPARASTGRPGS